MIKHKKNAHLLASTKKVTVECAMCSFTAPYTVMNEHYTNNHDIQKNIENFVFENEEDFKNWKQRMELSTRSNYVKNSGSSEIGNQIYSYYKCHRNGFYNSSSRGQRHLKTRGSNKING